MGALWLSHLQASIRIYHRSSEQYTTETVTRDPVNRKVYTQRVNNTFQDTLGFGAAHK